MHAIGRSRGGRGTKLHLVTDRLGRVLRVALTPGQRGDAPVAQSLLGPLPPPAHLLADAAYDSDRFRQFLVARGTTPVIPNNPTCTRTHPFNPTIYRARNTIERTIGRLKDWRRVHTRYDKRTTNYASATAEMARQAPRKGPTRSTRIVLLDALD